MKRTKYFAIGALILAVLFLGGLIAWRGLIASETKCRQIARALLDLQHQRSANGFRVDDRSWPASIEALRPNTKYMDISGPNPMSSYLSAGTNGAYIWWKKTFCGVEWCQGYDLNRKSPDDTNWTLYRFDYLTRPVINTGWKKVVMTFTNTP